MKIMAFLPDCADFTSFCRGSGPLNRLSRDFPDDFRVVYASPTQASWPFIQSADIILAQRPHTSGHLELCKTAKLSGRKLWIDFDDHFFAVETDNPGFEFFTQEKNKQNVRSIISLADLVTVSTPLLRDVYKPFVPKSGKIAVVPNSYDSTIFPYHKAPLQKRQPILWTRGSPTHFHDISCFADGIVAALNDKPDYKF